MYSNPTLPIPNSYFNFCFFWSNIEIRNCCGWNAFSSLSHTFLALHTFLFYQPIVPNIRRAHSYSNPGPAAAGIHPWKGVEVQWFHWTKNWSHIPPLVDASFLDWSFSQSIPVNQGALVFFFETVEPLPCPRLYTENGCLLWAADATNCASRSLLKA